MSGHLLQICALGAGGAAAAAAAGARVCGGRMPTSPSLPAAVVEMLLERGARQVVSFDIAGKPKFDVIEDPRLRYVKVIDNSDNNYDFGTNPSLRRKLA